MKFKIDAVLVEVEMSTHVLRRSSLRVLNHLTFKLTRPSPYKEKTNLEKKLQTNMNLRTTKKTSLTETSDQKEPQLSKVTVFLKTFESKLRRETRMTSLRLPFLRQNLKCCSRIRCR